LLESPVGPRAKGGIEKKESLAAAKLSREEPVATESSMKGGGRSEPACSDTTSASWTPTLRDKAVDSPKEDHQAVTSSGEESGCGNADGDDTQMTAGQGDLLPPLPDSISPSGAPPLNLSPSAEESEPGDVPSLAGQSWSSEDLTLEATTVATEETTVAAAIGHDEDDDLSWVVDDDWKFDFVEGLGLDVPRPGRFEEVENPTGSLSSQTMS
jgi:hypothetical protein